jgi:predicted amidohydrolase YtcJ
MQQVKRGCVLSAAVCLALGGMACGLSLGAQERAAPKADLVLIHGHILTEDAKDSTVQAVAIGGERIIAVGTDAQIQALAGPQTRVIDLQGRTATPGLIDSHAHIAEGGTSEVFDVPLTDATSIVEMRKRVAAKAATLKPGEWVVGSGWDEGKLQEKRLPTATDLDAVSPNNPVWLEHTTGHYGVANSAALKLAGITAATPDPTAGTIDRDAHGNPTGVLKESAAMDKVVDRIPPLTQEQIEAGILHIVETLHRDGMTAVKDPYIGIDQWRAYKHLADQGKLAEHVCVLWYAGTTVDSAREALGHIKAEAPTPGWIDNDRLGSCGAKIFMDGSGGARTAWSYEEWHKHATEPDTGNHGYPLVDPAIYRQMVKLFHENGVPVGTHAVGNHAIDWVVDTYAQVEADKPTVGLRHSIIHGNSPTPHALDTIAMLQKKYDAGYPEAQVEFLWWIGDIYAASYGANGANLIPLKTFLSRGIIWGGGSDFPVTPVAARYGIWAGAARETQMGTYGKQPFGTSEAIDARTSLRSYTAWNARQLFLEKEIGTLEPGKRADIAVWDRDLTAVPVAELKEMKCVLTLLDGKVVWEAK